MKAAIAVWSASAAPATASPYNCWPKFVSNNVTADSADSAAIPGERNAPLPAAFVNPSMALMSVTPPPVGAVANVTVDVAPVVFEVTMKLPAIGLKTMVAPVSTA